MILMYFDSFGNWRFLLLLKLSTSVLWVLSFSWARIVIELLIGVKLNSAVEVNRIQKGAPASR
jgi:hypothetical protein